MCESVPEPTFLHWILRVLSLTPLLCLTPLSVYFHVRIRLVTSPVAPGSRSAPESLRHLVRSLNRVLSPFLRSHN